MTREGQFGYRGFAKEMKHSDWRIPFKTLWEKERLKKQSGSFDLKSGICNQRFGKQKEQKKGDMYGKTEPTGYTTLRCGQDILIK